MRQRANETTAENGPREVVGRLPEVNLTNGRVPSIVGVLMIPPIACFPCRRRRFPLSPKEDA